MDEHSDEVSFISEQVELTAYEVIESTLKDNFYHESLVQGWVNDICQKITTELVLTNKPFKYIVTCTVMQKNGAGALIAHSCFWDAVNDNVVVVKWPNDRRKAPNARLQCFVSVYGVAY